MHSPVPYSTDLPMSKEKGLASARTNGTSFHLLEVSEGYEPAGSMARWTGACYRVRYELKDGTRCSQSYKTRAEAELRFKRLAVLGDK